MLFDISLQKMWQFPLVLEAAALAVNFPRFIYSPHSRNVETMSHNSDAKALQRVKRNLANRNQEIVAFFRKCRGPECYLL